MDNHDFAALLCSRLCHDLMSPVGALNNGLELLADENDPQMREQVIELLGDSAAATANKLKFFRLAFGAAGGFGTEIDTSEAREALSGLFGAEKQIELGWMVDEPRLPKDAVKLLLNLAMIAGDGLVRGGKLDVGAEREGDTLEIAIRAEGPRLIIDPNLRAVLEGTSDGDGEARMAGALLARQLATGCGGSLMVNSPAETLIVLGAQMPA